MAQIKMVEFDEEEGPQWVTIKLSLEEVAFIAKFTGKQSDDSAEGYMPNGGGYVNRQLYEATTHGVFNRWWDGGLEEYERERRR